MSFKTWYGGIIIFLSSLFYVVISFETDHVHSFQSLRSFSGRKGYLHWLCPITDSILELINTPTISTCKLCSFLFSLCKKKVLFTYDERKSVIDNPLVYMRSNQTQIVINSRWISDQFSISNEEKTIFKFIFEKDWIKKRKQIRNDTQKSKVKIDFEPKKG